MTTPLFPREGPLTDYLYTQQWEKHDGNEKRQGQGQDTSCPESNLQSVGSLVSDKNGVNWKAKEIPASALCRYKTSRAAVSVSHF